MRAKPTRPSPVRHQVQLRQLWLACNGDQLPAFLEYPDKRRMAPRFTLKAWAGICEIDLAAIA